MARRKLRALVRLDLPGEFLAGLHLGHEELLGFEAAAGAHGLEHFAHLGVLAEEVVDLLDGGSGAAGDALAAAPVDDLVVASASQRAMAVRRRSSW